MISQASNSPHSWRQVALRCSVSKSCQVAVPRNYDGIAQFQFSVLGLRTKGMSPSHARDWTFVMHRSFSNFRPRGGTGFCFWAWSGLSAWQLLGWSLAFQCPQG